MKFIVLCLLIANLGFSLTIEKVFNQNMTIQNEGRSYLKGQNYYFKANGALVIAQAVLTSGDKTMFVITKGIQHVNEGIKLISLKRKKGTQRTQTSQVKTTQERQTIISESDHSFQDLPTQDLQDNTGQIEAEGEASDSELHEVHESELDHVDDQSSVDEVTYEPVIPKDPNRFRRHRLYLGLGYQTTGSFDTNTVRGTFYQFERYSSLAFNIGYKFFFSKLIFAGVHYRKGLSKSQEVSEFTLNKILDRREEFKTSPMDLSLMAGVKFKGFLLSLGYALYTEYQISQDKLFGELADKVFGNGIRIALGYELFFSDRFGILFEGDYIPMKYTKFRNTDVTSGQTTNLEFKESISTNVAGGNVSFLFRF